MCGTLRKGRAKRLFQFLRFINILNNYVVYLFVYKSLEAVTLIPNNASLKIEGRNDSTLIATAGEKGKNLRCI